MNTHKSPVILMVDGDETISEPVRRTFEADGWVFIGVEAIQDAEREIARSRPDLVIVDLTMHPHSGISFARNTRSKGMLVIVMPDRSATALAGLAWPYLPKPFRPEDMQQLARSVLEGPLYQRRMTVEAH